MRPSGHMHIAHYHGVLKNWVRLQNSYDCFYFVADWHALTTEYQDTGELRNNSFEMVVDWLAAGLKPSSSTIFVQSDVPEHAELHVLLSMITPLAWLERVPTYKDQIDRINDRELRTYGFLGYPLLQAADILIYKAGNVPVGADQVAHVEISREIARRFNFIYGRDPDVDALAAKAMKKMPRKAARLFTEARDDYQERGLVEARDRAHALLDDQQNLSKNDSEMLHGYIDGTGRQVLPEPQALLTETPKIPGLDGEKMSKSYGNMISLREDEDSVDKKIRTMVTDPARVRRNDPGDPTKCPVYSYHEIYSDVATQEWASSGCRSASIGCLDCKRPLIEAVNQEQEMFRSRAQPYLEEPDLVYTTLREGAERASSIARETLDDVKSAIGL